MAREMKRFVGRWSNSYIPHKTKIVSDKAVLVKAKFKRDGYVTNVMRLISKETIDISFKNMEPDLEDKNNNVIIHPGIDGITKEEFQGNYEYNVESILRKLKDGTWRMTPALRINIPKANGKTRPISMLCTCDQLVQRTIADNILTPVYEEIFIETSYGYRPNRNTSIAINRIKEYINSTGKNTVIELDIKSFFDTIARDKLILMIKETIKDRKLIALIRSMIDTGYIENYELCKSNEGIFQGGILSPILANIYLHYVLDQWFIENNKDELLVRYADDAVIITKDKNTANTIVKQIDDRFKEYNLTLSLNKTKVVNLKEESITFLGIELIIDNNEIKTLVPKDRMDRKLKEIEIIGLNNKQELSKGLYLNIKKDNPFKYYQDYICRINNKLLGTYQYYRFCDDTVGSLLYLYESTVKIAKDYLISEGVTDVAGICSHIVSPISNILNNDINRK